MVFLLKAALAPYSMYLMISFGRLREEDCKRVGESEGADTKPNLISMPLESSLMRPTSARWLENGKFL